MSNLIPYGISKVIQYTEYVSGTNPEYDKEDIAWLNQLVIDMYYKLSEDAYKLYLLLTLLNQKSFTGYFARHFNLSIAKAVKKRDETSFINLILSPKIVEFESKSLTTEEKTETTNLTSLDVMSTNLALTRMLIRDTNGKDLEKIFEESRNELYNKLYNGSISEYRGEFQTFVIVTEYNPTSRTNHAYTFDLYSLLTGKISKNLTPETIAGIKETYSLEYKLTYHTHN